MARLAAHVADECRSSSARPRRASARAPASTTACTDAGRDPATLAMTLMTRCVLARDEAEQRTRLARMTVRDVRAAEGGGIGAWIVGTPEQVLSRIAGYQAAGITVTREGAYADGGGAEVPSRSQLSGDSSG